MKKFLLIIFIVLLPACSILEPTEKPLTTLERVKIIAQKNPDLKKIEIVIVDDAARWTDDKIEAITYYEGENTTVYIKKNISPEILPHTLFHEFCHVVWIEGFNSRTRSAWRSAFYEGQASISPYGEESAEEYFAEWCAYKHFKSTRNAFEPLNPFPIIR